ncbi:hypothetical protein OIU77_015968 [Salix suchowensis]|uniref:Uncharacterized protein n=1 Tax=Salix suchowensis TaxID=1278906 RepID=A0ABQ8ZIW6_9ROSI|nr:hypothetical protein OIU77_015968 [Salix suchowensis]
MNTGQSNESSDQGDELNKEEDDRQEQGILGVENLDELPAERYFRFWDNELLLVGLTTRLEYMLRCFAIFDINIKQLEKSSDNEDRRIRELIEQWRKREKEVTEKVDDLISNDSAERYTSSSMEKKADFKKVQHGSKKMSLTKWLKGSVKSDEHLELIQAVKDQVVGTGNKGVLSAFHSHVFNAGDALEHILMLEAEPHTDSDEPVKNLLSSVKEYEREYLKRVESVMKEIYELKGLYSGKPEEETIHHGVEIQIYEIWNQVWNSEVPELDS